MLFLTGFSETHDKLLRLGRSLSFFDPEQVGIVVGSVCGNLSGTVEYLERLFTKGPALASPLLFPNLVLNAAKYTPPKGAVGGRFMCWFTHAMPHSRRCASSSPLATSDVHTEPPRP